MKCYSTEKAGGAEGAAHKAEQEKQKKPHSESLRLHVISMRITVRARECKVVVMGKKLIKGRQKHIHLDHV